MDRQLYLKEVNDYCGSNFVLNEEDRDNWFRDILINVYIKKDKKYPFSIFMFIDNTLYFEIDFKTNNVYVSSRFIWSILQHDFNMNIPDIRSFIKLSMKKHTENKLIYILPVEGSKIYFYHIEEYFKLN